MAEHFVLTPLRSSFMVYTYHNGSLSNLTLCNDLCFRQEAMSGNTSYVLFA